MSPKRKKAIVKGARRKAKKKGRIPADEARPILCPWPICTVHKRRAPG